MYFVFVFGLFGMVVGLQLTFHQGYNPDNVSLPPRDRELSLEDIARLPRGCDPATDLRELEELPEDVGKTLELLKKDGKELKRIPVGIVL